MRDIDKPNRHECYAEEAGQTHRKKDIETCFEQLYQIRRESIDISDSMIIGIALRDNCLIVANIMESMVTKWLA